MLDTRARSTRRWRQRSPDAPAAEQQAVDDQLRRHIVAVIRALPPKLRDTLLLAQAGEYTYEEISAMLGAPLGTIKWRVSEARRVVQQALVAARPRQDGA